MESNLMEVCSVPYAESKPTPSDVYGWWDCNVYDSSCTKKKKKGKSKRKKRKRKEAQKKLTYHLLNKAADTACDILKMYFEQKFSH